MTDTKRLVIIVTPRPPSELRSIFSREPNSIKGLLENPPELRPHGWGLHTGGIAKSIKGESIQTEGFRTIATLYRDGQFIVVCKIDRDSLAWSDQSDRRIHPLAFVEFVVNTLRFYNHVLADMRTAPKTLAIEVQLANLTEGEGTDLPSGGINNLGWISGVKKSAPEPSLLRRIAVDANPYDARRAAFLLLREIYI